MAATWPTLHSRLSGARRATGVALLAVIVICLAGAASANVHYDAFFHPGQTGNWETASPPEIQLTVSRREPAIGEATVGYRTEDVTATAGLDYKAASGTVTFPDNQAHTTITITIINDSDPEPGEEFRVHLEPGRGTPNVGPATTAFIASDEGPEPPAPANPGAISHSSGPPFPPDPPRGSPSPNSDPPPPTRQTTASSSSQQAPQPPPQAPPSGNVAGVPALAPPPSTSAADPPAAKETPVLTVGPGSAEGLDEDGTSAEGSGPLGPMLLASVLLLSLVAPAALSWYRRRSTETQD